jgi:anti-anti-sigma factor
MKIGLERIREGVVVIGLNGRLDAAAAREVQECLEEAFAGGSTNLVVDLSKVSFIDSTGLGTLVSGLKVARRAEGDVRLVAPNSQVRKLLQLTTLDRVFRVSDSLAEV